MQFFKLQLLLLNIALLLLVACSNVATPNTKLHTPVATLTTQVNPSLVQSNQANLLVAATGPVGLKRESWKDYIPIAVGTLLRPTDLLDVQDQVIVLCVGPESKTVTALGRVPCPLERGWFEYDGTRFSSSQRGAPKEIPYILYPRNTLLLNPYPVFQWHDSKAASYTVSLKANGIVVWRQANVAGTSIPYPTNEPPLQPNNDYLLIVQDDITQSISTADPAKGLGFRIISVANRGVVEQQRERIEALPALDEPARNLALAVYYATWTGERDRQLWGEAWLLLEQIAQTQDTPRVQMWMGDMLRTMKLPVEATAAYQNALQQAEVLGDSESQAEARVNLWRLTGDKSQLEMAIQLYQTLGDQIQADVLAAQLKP